MKRLFYTLLVMVFALVSKNGAAQVGNIGRNTGVNLGAQGRQLQGNIAFAGNTIAQQLQQGWNASLAQAVGNHIKVELWQVSYSPDPKDKNFVNIFLQQRLNANVSYQLTQEGIQYRATYKPAPGPVVVIAYTDVQPNATLKFSGKPSDGVPASITHQFRANAKKFIGNNNIYGIYSISNSQMNMMNIDFQIKSTIKVNCKNCFSLDDVWDTVQEGVDDVANFVKAKVDGGVDALKNLGETIVTTNGAFYIQCFGMVATFLQTGQTPKARMLKDYGDAYNIANSTIFMNTLPPVDNIIVTNLMSVDKRAFTIPISNGHTFIIMNLGDAFEDPMNYSQIAKGDLFMHELTHAWQIWNTDALRLYQDAAVNQFKNSFISNQYAYNCDVHNMTDSYNEEQQAMIVQHFYTALFYGKTWCGFEQQWVVQNILKNQPGNMNLRYSATIQLMNLSHDRTIAGYTGGVVDHEIAFPSNGNRIDGTGYFLPGKNNNSFFYYSGKTNAVSANWGPIRDKFIKENYEFGELGWPERSEALLPDAKGYFQKFNHGFIYWSTQFGAHTVLNKIFDGWMKVGWEAGKLGYPVGDYVSEVEHKGNQFTEFLDKGYQAFAGGVIFYVLPTTRLAQAAQNQNYTSIEYGDPNKIIAMHKQAHTSFNPGATVQINPQPLPPKDAKQTVSAAERVQINPQPLPPKNGKRVPSSAKVQINPQPLPPKTVTPGG